MIGRHEIPCPFFWLFFKPMHVRARHTNCSRCSLFFGYQTKQRHFPCLLIKTQNTLLSRTSGPIPGGFVLNQESLEAAVWNANCKKKPEFSIKLFRNKLYTFWWSRSRPEKNGSSLWAYFCAGLNPMLFSLAASTDASDAAWFPDFLNYLPWLFDHDQILKKSNWASTKPKARYETHRLRAASRKNSLFSELEKNSIPSFLGRPYWSTEFLKKKVMRLWIGRSTQWKR